MIEFNADGSIKIPERIAGEKRLNEEKLKNQRCMKIKKEVVSFDSPKKCMLRLRLSDSVSDSRFVKNIYDEFEENSTVPSKFSGINEKEFEVEIGTEFRRCTECCSLVAKYKGFIEVIEEKGNCAFEQRNFCYEDYFE